MRAYWADGLTIESADAEYQVRIGALIRLDGRDLPVGAVPGTVTDTLTMRTVRTTIQGRITKFFTFRLVPDFASSTSTLSDAFVDLGLSERVHVRFGRDKTPSGFETLLGDANVLFMERGLTLNLVPGRDVGVQVYGDLAGGNASYVVGVFNGTVDGTQAPNLDTDNGKELVARGVVHPFFSARTPFLEKLGFGFGGSREDQEGPLPSFKTANQQSYFAYAPGVVADGLHTRVSPQVFHYYKSFSVYSEYARSRQAVRKGDVGTSVTNTAWQVASAYILTGETAGERVRPKEAFDPGAHKWGALQVMARYGTMTLDPVIFASGLAGANSSQHIQASSLGAIWFMTTNVKVIVNAEHSSFDHGKAGARKSEDGFLFRVQLKF